MLVENLVSVIVPCYNQGIYLNDTLESIYKQTHTNWECLVVNDGSTDHTERVVKQWLLKDSRFKYILQENRGLSAARNTGIHAAQGEYIQLLDSDDLILEDKFTIQLKHLETNDVSICDYFPFVHGKISEKAPYRYLTPSLAHEKLLEDLILNWEYRKSFPPHCVLFKSSLLNLNKDELRFIDELPNHEDWVFWVMLFHRTDLITQTSLVLAKYRIHTQSMSSNLYEMQKGFLQAINILENYFLEKKDPRTMGLIREKRKEVRSRQHKKESLIWKFMKRLYRKTKLKIKC